jgi:hypothetical protein
MKEKIIARVQKFLAEHPMVTFVGFASALLAMHCRILL